MIAGFIRLFIVFGIIFGVIYLIYRFFKSIHNTNEVLKEKNRLKTAHDNAIKNKPHNSKGYSLHFDSQNMTVTEFKVAGVTFKDGRYTRQAALRKMFFKDPPMDGPIDFEFEDYEYDEKPAILIKANERIIGNVPADLVSEFIQLRDTCSSMELNYKVSGGGDYPFGCKMIITWRFNNDN